MSMEKHYLKYKLRTIQDELGYYEWADKLPYIAWPENWEIKATPAFNGLMVRYWVRLKGADSADSSYVASIYLDCHNFSGVENWPYWEVHPVGGDCGRCKWDNIEGKDGLLDLIARSLRGE